MDNNEEMKEWLGKDEKVRESGGKKCNSTENEAANSRAFCWSNQ